MAEPLLTVAERIRSDDGNYYRVIQELGNGGNSIVYLVIALTGQTRGVLFAMKVFVKIQDGTRLARFFQEISVLQQCSHPAIMQVYAKGIIAKIDEEGRSVTYPFLIADYLPQTLRSLMLSGQFSMAHKLTFCLQMLSGLVYLSSINPQIVHRDIKPENIFVRGKSFLLGDFGLIKTLSSVAEDDVDFLMDSVGPRLPRFYRTPDLVDYCRNKRELTVKSDIYQLGLVFAEVFTNENPLKLCKNILDPVELEIMGEIKSDQGVSIGALVQRMLTESVEARPNAEELFDPWDGVFRTVINSCHGLEGRVF